MGYKHDLVLILQVPAAAAQAQGQPVRSAGLWGAIEALREGIGTTFSPVERHFFSPYIAAARDQLDEETWEAAMAEVRAMTPEQAIEYALAEEEEPAAPRQPCLSNRRPPDRRAGSPAARKRSRYWWRGV